MELNYFKPLSQNAKEVKPKIEDFVDIEMMRNEAWIRQRIRERWLKGLKPDGSIIGEYASESYAEDKFSMNRGAGFGNVDLTLTKSLGQKIEMGGFQDEYEIFSKDRKYDEIVDKYGEDNFNITPEQEKELLDKVMAYALNEALNQIYE